jgi:hypothetical protein
VACPECALQAHKVFNPRAVMIQIPESLRYVKSDFQPLSTAQHTSSYLEGKLIDDTSRGIHEHWEKASRRKTIKERLLEKYPDTNLDAPMTKAESAELRTLLAQGPPVGTK